MVSTNQNNVKIDQLKTYSEPSLTNPVQLPTQSLLLTK